MTTTNLAPPSDDLRAVMREAGYWLHLIRSVEESGRTLYLQGRLPGSFYDGRGQEATAIGAALAMDPEDIACPLIRDMGVHLVRGVSVSEMFRHYLGKSGGPMEGRDGNIHLGSFENGTIPMISHLPEMLPVGLGVAMSRSRRGRPAAAVGFCGDGASSGGVFHETLNLAAVWNAPLVVVVERNGFAYMTPETGYLATDSIVERAQAYGIEGVTVDGNDVVAVYQSLRVALSHARSGQGPVLIEAFTYRMHGHGAHDAQKYVPEEELTAWALKDPLKRWHEWAEEHLGWTSIDQGALEDLVARETRAGLDDALAAPYPASHDLLPSVFAR